jgi:hypothetical protein
MAMSSVTPGVLAAMWITLNVVAAPASGPATVPSRATVGAMRVLSEQCLSCHNREKKKGGLLLTSRQAALEGGDDGPAIVPGDAQKSPLIIALAADADPHMPPKKQLTEGQIETLTEWVKGGAPWDEAALTAKPAATTRPIALRPLPATYHPVLALALSPDQTRLAVGRGDHLLIFDLSKKPAALAMDLATANDLVEALAWSGDGKWLASGGFRAVRVWDLKSSQPVRTFNDLAGRVSALAFTPDGASLIAGEGEPAMPGVVRGWKLEDGEAVMKFTAHADAIFSMKLADGGKTLFTAGADKLVKQWSLPEGKEIGKFEGHTAQVMAVAVSPDGTRLASAAADREVKVWDLKTRDQLVAFAGLHQAGVTDVTWTDDKHVISASEDGAVRIFNVENKDRAEKAFNDAGDVVYCVAVAKDGTVYAGCHDGNVYVWSPANSKLEGKLAP